METENQLTHNPEPVASESREPSLEPLTYSVAETAQVLGISPPTVYRLIARRLLRPLPYMRHKRIPKRQVHALVNGGSLHE